MCKYFWEKNYIDQFLIPPCLPLQSKGKTAPSIFVFRKVLDCKHLKQIKGGWPVHPTLFPGFQSFQQQPSVCRKEGGPVEYKRDRRCLCLRLRFKARSKQQSSKWPTLSPLLQGAAGGKDFRQPAKESISKTCWRWLPPGTEDKGEATVFPSVSETVACGHFIQKLFRQTLLFM